MIEDVNESLKSYWSTWQDLLAERHDRRFFENLKPLAVGWKTEDAADFERRFADLRDQCDQIHFGWMNERWIVVLHLKDVALFKNIELIKLMQRRPDSTDSPGLDHVDFYSPAVAQADAILAKEPSLHWTHEENGPCKWISVWFDSTEAKLRTDTTLDVSIAELKEVKEELVR